MSLCTRIRNESYTVFILPFAYRLERLPPGNGKGWVKDNLNPPDLSLSDARASRRPPPGNAQAAEKIQESRNRRWREVYFTPETRMVLFDRARWFRTTAPDLKLVCTPHDGDKANVFLEQPRLVLFEFDGERLGDAPDRTGPGSDSPTRNGMLMVKAWFPEGATLRHLLCLNEWFRYYKVPYWDHPGKRAKHLQNLPGKADAKSYGAFWKDLLERPVPVGKEEKARLVPTSPIVPKVAPNGLTSGTGTAAESDSAADSWDVYPDNRVYVWTAAVLEGENGPLPDLTVEGPAVPSSPDIRGALIDWYPLLNVDPDAPDATDLDGHTWAWIRDRTYTRWCRKGTWYGFNDCSTALMTTSSGDVPLWHYETMYLDMGLLLLQVRTSLFRFSREISRISAAMADDGRDRKWSDEFRRLRRDFAAFVNLYQFPLLSTQQQAIEMYERLRRHLDIDELFREVQAEVSSTHEFAEMVEQAALNKAVSRFAPLSIGLAVAALVASWFGMGLGVGTGSTDWDLVRAGVLSVGAFGVSWGAAFLLFKRMFEGSQRGK